MANEASVKFTTEEAPSSTRGTWPRFFSWNDSDNLDAGTSIAVLSKVAEVWKMRSSGIPALLFGDQLAAHRRADTVEYALDLGLFLFPLAKNTSQLIHPLDEAPSGVLHLVTRNNHEEAVMDGMLTNSKTRDALLMAAYDAERRGFTRPIIRLAFRRRGLRPFDPELMQSNVRANLGMVETGETPVEAARRATAAVLQDARERAADVRGTVASGRFMVQRGVFHSPFLLLEKHRQASAEAAKERQDNADRTPARAKKKAGKERDRAEKAAARALRRCCVCTDKEYRGGKAWTGSVQQFSGMPHVRQVFPSGDRAGAG